MAHDTLIDDAFSKKIELAKKVHDAMRKHPNDVPLYVEIAEYVRDLRSDVAGNRVRDEEAIEPATKKRKLKNGTALAAGEESLPDHTSKVLFEARDLSFSIPMRKKLHLEVAQVTSPSSYGAQIYQVRARHPASGEIEYKVGMQSFSIHTPSTFYADNPANGRPSEYALRLPVPEKAQKQHNFVFLPEAGLGIGDKPFPNGSDSKEPLVWTVNDGPQKLTTFDDKGLGNSEHLHDGSLIEQTLNKCLEKTSATKVIGPDDAEFASATPEAHRKGEKAYHVKAFRGSKDGYLYFLGTGIFFGFKKPLTFFPFEVINSISYTSVLQRTFNLNIAVQLPDQEEIKDHEFSMIDQADFAGIDAYIKRHGLQDASLAESRKAKKLKLNGAAKGDDKGGVVEEEEHSELQKAQQDMEDAEDEEEEDYDPGSEGLSDGSGESSEEEEEEFVEGNVAGGDQDLAAEELGSEAEENVPDPSDHDQL